MSLAVGTTVPLEAQVQCQADDVVYVQVTVKDPDRNELFKQGMINGGDGLFFNYDYNMPDLEFITAQYVPYSDAGFTTPHPDFCPSSESFVRANEISPVDIGINRVSVIELDVRQAQSVTAYLDTRKLIAEQIDNNMIEATFYKDKVDYFLDNNEIQGET